MNEFEKAQEFGLGKYFEEGKNVRVQLRELFAHAKDTVAREREINLEVVLLVAALERQNAAMNLCMWGGKKELAQALGLTMDQYLKRAQAGRVLWNHPEFIDLIRAGKTYVSHVGTLAAKITDANKDIFLQEIAGKTEKELRSLVASVNRDGSRNQDDEITFDLRLTLTKSQLAVLERAKEVLSATGSVPSDEEVLVRALEDLLEKRDPMQKAERAMKRAASVASKNVQDRTKVHAATHGRDVAAVPHGDKVRRTRYIPAAVMHAVTVRDRGRCSYRLRDGYTCGSKIGIQYDHVIPVAHHGTNDATNIRLLCREHNILEAKRLIGVEVMQRY